MPDDEVQKMTPERYRQIDEIFHAALERPNAERVALLEQLCQDDKALLEEVAALLRSHEEASSFIESPVFNVAADLMTDDQSKPMIGQHFGPYEIMEKIGAGGMGAVYLAFDKRLNRKVAIKVLPAFFTANLSRLARFQQEARTASVLNHPNILTIFDIGQTGSTHYLVTEYISGVTLRKRLTDSPLSLEDSLQIAVQIADALSTAHQAGIIHRDIKPENVMLRPDGYVKVVDFGLAKHSAVDSSSASAENNLTGAGMVVGTPGYMSPEQVRGLPVDARTDIFSLGVTLYEMITGCAPFRAPTRADAMAAVLQKEPPPLAHHQSYVPDRLEQIVQKSLMKEAEQRYQNVIALLKDLKQLQKQLEVETGKWLSPISRSASRDDESLRSKVYEESPGDFTKSPDQKNTIAVPTSVVAESAVRRNSLAVLPFKMLSVSDSDEYWGVGLANALITRLINIRQITVRPTTAVLPYAQSTESPAVIGRELRVESVLDGTIQTAGNRLRVTVQLINVREEISLWAEKFDEALADIFDMQDSISEKIIKALTVKLSREEHEQIRKRYTENPEAYQSYLKGIYFLNRRSAETLQKAIEAFRKAIEQDPQYALAYAGLAETYFVLSYVSTHRQEAIRQAKTAVQRALSLDGEIAEVQVARATLNWREYNWEAAEDAFQKALRLNLNSATTHYQYALVLLSLRRFNEADKEMQRALELDPLSIIFNSYKALLYIGQYRYDEAILQCLKVMEMDANFLPNYGFLGIAYQLKGEYEKAVASFEKQAQLEFSPSPLVLSQLAHAYAKAGQTDKARRILNNFLKQHENGFAAAEYIASIYTGLGEIEEAVCWFEKAMHDQGQLLPAYLNAVDPRFEPLYNNPRIIELRRRINLL